VLLDISITSSFQGSSLKGATGALIPPPSRKVAKKTAVQAAAAYRMKMNKYKNIFSKFQNDDTPSHEKFSVIPIIFETSGLMHDESRKFISKVAEQAELKENISSMYLEKYYLRRLSVCLQKGIAKCITSRLYRLLGSADYSITRSFNYDLITSDDPISGY